MPANLTPEYRAAEEKLRNATSLEERIEALDEMLAKIPKHKGTEKLQADLKSRLAKLRKQLETKGGGPARRREKYHIPKEGAGRVIVAGAPNTGKSRLFTAMTTVPSEVADYPFTTRSPVVGMMPFEDISIQVIDLPPLSSQFMESWVPQIIRLADVMLLVVDVTSLDPVKQIEEPLAILREKKIEAVPVSTAGGKAFGEEGGGMLKVKTIVAAGFMDVEGAAEMLDLLKSESGMSFALMPVSAASGQGLPELRRALFKALGVKRIYSKQPGRKHSPEPFVLKEDATIIDFAGKVHRDFVEKFQFARVWRKGEGMEGMRASRDFLLADGDVVELHI